MTHVPFPSLSGLAPMRLPAFLLTLVLTVALALPAAMGAVPRVAAGLAAEAQSPTASPETLRPRAEEYWRLLVSGDRAGASMFMHPDDRPTFLQGREQAFRDPTVETIELSGDATRATLEIAFDMLTPVGVFPWKINQEWSVSGGEWMAEPRETSGNPFVPLQPPPDPQ